MSTASSLLRRSFAAALICGLGVCSPGWQSTAQAGAFPFQMKRVALENGLQLVMIPYDSPGLITYYTLVRTGSRNEVEPGHTGFAHFFEHMMFRGTDKYPPGKRDEIVVSMGGDDNAYTTNDYTAYFVVAPTDGLAKIVDVESDRFQHLKYGLEAFQTESRAVLGEYNKNHSQPEGQMEESMAAKAFQVHTYQHTTIGFLKDIEDMPNQYQYSLEFFKRYYAPDNCTVFVVGDFDPVQAEKLVREAYSGWKSRSQAREVKAEPKQTGERRVELKWPTATVSRLTMGYKTPSFSQSIADNAALTVLSEYGFGETSPLFKRLVLDQQLVLSLGGGVELSRDPGLAILAVQVDEPGKLKTAQEAIDAEIKLLQESPIDAGRLAAIKSHLRYAALMHFNTGLGVVSSLGQFAALACAPQPNGTCLGQPEKIDEYYAALDAVTAADLQRVARTLLVPSGRTVVTLVPETKKAVPAGKTPGSTSGKSKGGAR